MEVFVYGTGVNAVKLLYKPPEPAAFAASTQWFVGSREELIARIAGGTDAQMDYALKVSETFPYLPNGDPIDGGTVILPLIPPPQKNSGASVGPRDRAPTSVKATEVSYVELTIEPIPPRYWVADVCTF